MLDLRWLTEESHDFDQPTVGADFAQVDRCIAGPSVSAYKPPQETQHVVVGIDTTDEFDPGARPRCLNF